MVSSSLARLLPSAVRVRIRSRSTSASPPSTASIKRPMLLSVSTHGSANDRNYALESAMRLTMPNRSKVLRARRSMRVTVTTSPGGQVLELLEKLAAVVVRARDLLAINSAAPFGAQLLKLRVELLSVRAHAGIAETPVFGG